MMVMMMMKQNSTHKVSSVGTRVHKTNPRTKSRKRIRIADVTENIMKYYR
jgi:hypothetical protein